MVLIGVTTPCPEIPQWYNWGCQVRICIVKNSYLHGVLNSVTFLVASDAAIACACLALTQI